MSCDGAAAWWNGLEVWPDMIHAWHVLYRQAGQLLVLNAMVVIAPAARHGALMTTGMDVVTPANEYVVGQRNCRASFYRWWDRMAARAMDSFGSSTSISGRSARNW